MASCVSSVRVGAAFSESLLRFTNELNAVKIVGNPDVGPADWGAVITDLTEIERASIGHNSDRLACASEREKHGDTAATAMNVGSGEIAVGGHVHRARWRWPWTPAGR